ncbi:MAG: M15 family metallopeptidase [Actinomycetota bacterium]|nr:M15 family metallopeptidase [Actinomycetota bacterium]
MSRRRDAGARIAAAVVGVVVGVGLIFVLGAVGGTTESGTRPTSSPPTSRVTASPESDPSPSPTRHQGDPDHPGSGPRDAFLAWAPGSLPAHTEREIDVLRVVRTATTVYAGLDWIKSWTLPGARSPERPPPGYAIPFEIASVQPNEYARFALPDDRRPIRGLDAGEALLAETSRKLRSGGRGLRIDLGERRVRVVGTVDDRSTNGYEALIAGPPPPEWARADRFVLARLKEPGRRRTVERKIESLLPPGQPLQTRIAGENPFLRYGDAVLPQLIIKDTFGEFAARPLEDGRVEIEPHWVRRNITTARVPILGEVTCHRLLFPQLRAALRDIQRQGLAHAIHPEQFAGCYSPRFISSNPDGRLSHHSWGVAIDINAWENGFGTKADLDMRIVEIFEDRWGFTWGGRWIVPDGMHFEWVKFP